MTEEEDNIVPVFQTQVLDCDKDNQHLEQSELSIYTCFSHVVRLVFSVVLPSLCT